MKKDNLPFSFSDLIAAKQKEIKSLVDNCPFTFLDLLYAKMQKENESLVEEVVSEVVKQELTVTYPGVALGKYVVTEDGEIFTVRKRKPVAIEIDNGYKVCNLTTAQRGDRLYLVDRLVAWDFVKLNRDLKLQVGHIDGNKLNNHYTNLEWLVPGISNIVVPRSITYPGVKLGRYTISEDGEIFNIATQKFVSQYTSAGFKRCNLMTSDGGQKVFAIYKLMEWEFGTLDKNIGLDKNQINKNAIISRPVLNSNVISRPITYPGVKFGRYTITQDAEIFNVVTQKIVAQHIRENGYKYCHLMTSDGGQYSYAIHRLVGWEFVLTNRNISLQINHIDGNKLNNHYTNLEWVTGAENVQHAIRTGLTPAHPNQGETHGMSKLTDEDVHRICKILENPKVSYEAVANAIGNKVGLGTIISIATGKAWTHISKQYKIPHRAKGGMCHPMSKLTDNDVHRICKMLENPKASYIDIASRFNNVTPSAVIEIAHGRTWTEISSQYNIPLREYERPTGEDHPMNKLTEKQVHKICEMLEEDPHITYQSIIDKLNLDVSVHAIYRIANGDNWQEISKQYKIPRREVIKAGIGRTLTEGEVRFVCERLQDPLVRYTDIANDLNNKVSSHTIMDIAKGTLWSSVSKDYNIPPRDRSLVQRGKACKLTEEVVRFICEERVKGTKVNAIAAKLNNEVSPSSIRAIINGYNWTHISSEYGFIPKK